METLLNAITDTELQAWEQWLGDWFFVLSFAFLAFELIRYAVQKRLGGKLLGDTLTNFLTLAFYLGIGVVVYGAFYVSSFYFVYQFAIFDIQNTLLTVLVCIVLADLIYYWEHRFLHRVGIGWATHTVHHSSPHFNISVAYRFGPMDDFWPILFHLPLVLLGFDPLVVFFSSMMVQLYQTILHTEVIGKLPRPIEFLMNTPSHHRVHHGSNPQYIDKNYAGIFILWDRLFGTFAEEEETVVYGITQPVKSNNPFRVFFHGLTRLGRQMREANGWGERLALMIMPPGWEPASGDQEPRSNSSPTANSAQR
ncbi:MAG: sterol desaturase family protein [Pseudomonadota bacterium]